WLPGATGIAAGAFKLKSGAVGKVTVSITVAVSVMPPPVAVMVTGYVPGEVLAARLKVMTDVPAPGAGMLTGLKLIVTPLGAPEADRLIALLNEPISRVETSMVPYSPCPTVTAPGASRANVGAVDICCTPRYAIGVLSPVLMLVPTTVA